MIGTNDKLHLGFDNYKTIFDNCITDFSREFGERSARKIINTIKKSRHTKNLITQCKNGGFMPNSGDLNSFVLSNLSMMFASTEKVRFASIILLNEWQKEVNMKLKIAEEYEVIELLMRVFRKTI